MLVDQQIPTVLGHLRHLILTLTEYLIQLTIVTTYQIQDKEDTDSDGVGDVCQDTTEEYIFVKKWGSVCEPRFDDGRCVNPVDGQFSNPTGLAVDSLGFVYVIDYFNNRIQKFTNDGTFVTKWGSQGMQIGAVR